MSLEPLEVFALTSDMQRATGSIPYTSLMWNRKYYECGDFLMEVPASVYDPSWAYIYTEERPETGIIQKVEYSDTSQVAGGVDTVILSGFFMEAELNRYTFLVEETEEEAYRIYKPAPAKTSMPTMWADGEGNAYLKKGGKGGVPVRWETIDGEPVDTTKTDVTGFEEIPLEPGEGLKLIEYDTNNLDKFPTGKWNAGEYTNRNYSYYSEDGETLHSVAPDGTETTYDIVQGSGGDVIYRDADNTYHWVNGVASSLSGTYVRARDSWESMVRSEGLEVVTGDGTIMGGSTYARAYRTVKGPWQLRTDLDVNEPADNVQRIIQWAQDIWGNNLLYDEVGFEGESKIIDPSLRLFGDLAYEELKTIEASPRLFYSFESDTAVLQIWRGLDRTQSQAGVPSPDVPEPEPEEPTIDDLYEAVDYIQSDGSQYIDTGIVPNQDTRVVFEGRYEATSTAKWLFGSRESSNANNYSFLCEYSKLRTDYNKYVATGFFDESVTVATLVDKDKNVTTVNGSNVVAGTYATFTCPGSLYLFANNNNGAAAGFSIARSKAWRIYDNGTLVRDYIPMRRKADGVYGLLDLVNEVFYESASGVPFAGPSYPAGTYEELDYIVATGEQYIDTGVNPNQSTRVVMEADVTTPSGTAWYKLFGGNTSTSSGGFSLWRNGNGKFEIDYGATVSQPTISGTNLHVDWSANVCTINGTSTTLTASTFTAANTMYVGDINAYAGSSYCKAMMRLKSFRIYGDGTTLDRDFVPRRRVSDGAVGLLDLANDTFYESAGTEPFYAPGELPSGYTRLEYIESTGSQYIDTGVAPKWNTRVIADVQMSAYSATRAPFGYRNTNSTTASLAFTVFQTSATAFRSDYFGSSASLTVDSTANRVVIDKNMNELTVDGASVTNTAVTSGEGNGSIYLFTYNSNGSAGGLSSMKLYCCQMYEDGALVRDYIPVKNSSGEAGLFDLVTMTFYEDAAGVGFIAGPEVAAVAEASTFSLTRTVAASETTEETANPFAVFSDTWGTLYGFTASKDVSNYRNTCYVLYQFRDATDEDGNQIGPRGYVTARLEDEMPDAETYLDLRGEEPEDDQTDEAFIESLRQRGIAHLKANYAIIESLDTGTLVQDGYLSGFDLGDKVDMLVEAVGLVKEARITGCCEIHEAGSSTVSLEIGEQKLTDIRKAVIV